MKWLLLACAALGCEARDRDASAGSSAPELRSAPSTSAARPGCAAPLPSALREPLKFTSCKSKPSHPDYPECRFYQLDPKSTPGCPPSRLELVISGHGLLEGYGVYISPKKSSLELRLAEDAGVFGTRARRGRLLGTLELESNRVKGFVPDALLHPYVAGVDIPVDD
ncbi:MAG: hypothetical protein KC766_03825 [Myxococcales bacterium]|nr:hypothetical protein [Myxococcales bacterium]